MEKRLYERISVPVKIKYEVKNRPKLTKETVSKDLSGGGICLSLREKLLPKTQLTMKVEIGSSNDSINLNGKVAWNRRVEVAEEAGANVYYDTGIEFIDADPININRVVTHFYGKSF